LTRPRLPSSPNESSVTAGSRRVSSVKMLGSNQCGTESTCSACSASCGTDCMMLANTSRARSLSLPAFRSWLNSSSSIGALRWPSLEDGIDPPRHALQRMNDVIQKTSRIILRLRRISLLHDPCQMEPLPRVRHALELAFGAISGPRLGGHIRQPTARQDAPRLRHRTQPGKQAPIQPLLDLDHRLVGRRVVIPVD